MKGKKPDEMVTLTIMPEHVTEKAVLIMVGMTKVWLPFSQMKRESDAPPIVAGEHADIEIPEWIAKRNGLIS